MPFAVILNTASGSATPDARRALDDAIVRHAIDARVFAVDGAGIRRTAEKRAAAGDALVAAGGDGTVSTVAGVAVDAAATLGVVPLGTLNHFARDAGIRLE